MTVVVDRALCLQRHPFSESSLIVHAITANHGRVHLLARGAYRPTSRYFCVLDLFDELELEWDASPRRDLQLLRSGSIRVRRRVMRTSLDHFKAASTILELADIAARHMTLDPKLFELVTGALSALERPDARADCALVRFELQFLEHLGLAPALETCASCGKDAPPIVRTPHLRAAFSAGAGGRLCRACADEARSAGRRVGTLPVSVLDDGRSLAVQDAKLIPALDPKRVERVRDFLGRFLDYHLETRPKSQRAFLAVPNRNAPKSASNATDSA
ncbi:MAG: DNA repair protein RecO [Planctomycetota bacterium]|nr:DNA repair protein RecO [Planctomycetota bacterium]